MHIPQIMYSIPTNLIAKMETLSRHQKLGDNRSLSILVFSPVLKPSTSSLHLDSASPFLKLFLYSSSNCCTASSYSSFETSSSFSTLLHFATDSMLCSPLSNPLLQPFLKFLKEFLSANFHDPYSEHYKNIFTGLLTYIIAVWIYLIAELRILL